MVPGGTLYETFPLGSGVWLFAAFRGRWSLHLHIHRAVLVQQYKSSIKVLRCASERVKTSSIDIIPHTWNSYLEFIPTG